MERGDEDHNGGKRRMKRVVKLITIIAILMIAVGGSLLDSSNIAVPIAIMVPGILWIGARVVITEVFK